MKRVLLTICSICLVLACLFGLFAVVGGMKDILNIQDYKTKQGEEGREGIETAIAGIGQLKENESTYLDGAKQYTEGQQTLADAEVTLANGYSQFYAGQQQVAAGQAEIDANTQAYNEGKELLAKIEPLMPLVNTYVSFRNGTLAFLPGFSDAQAWFASKVAPLGAELGLELPADVTDLPGYIQTMVAEGQAKLKQYEDGLVALANGKAQLSSASVQLADGENQIAAGKQQLIDADAQLKVFEDGEAQVIAGMELLLEEMVAVEKRDGTHQDDSLAQMLGDDFDLYVKEADGTVKVVRGVQYVNFDNCLELVNAASDYLDNQEAQIASELYGRIGLYVALAIGCIFGIVGGLVGFVGALTGGKKTGFVCGLITLILAAGANIAGMFMGYTNYAYLVEKISDTGLKTYEYSGDTQFAALIIVALAALLFVIVAAIERSAAKKAEAKASVDATKAAAAAAAEAASKMDYAGSEKIAQLAAENAELKEMISKLAAEIATVKE